MKKRVSQVISEWDLLHNKRNMCFYIGASSRHKDRRWQKEVEVWNNKNKVEVKWRRIYEYKSYVQYIFCIDTSNSAHFFMHYIHKEWRLTTLWERREGKLTLITLLRDHSASFLLASTPASDVVISNSTIVLHQATTKSQYAVLTCGVNTCPSLTHIIYDKGQEVQE